MPIYEYVCLECGEEFENLVFTSAGNKELKCPKCRSPKLEQKISGFSSVSAGKGSGVSSCAPGGG